MLLPALIVAAADVRSPLFWAVFVGWIMSVVLHEFGHGLVAHWGGDYTIRERGGLSLNPLQYVDPVGSLLLPAIFLALGGVPLPGGANYIRIDLLRTKWWSTAVSLAGPAVNLILFVIGAVVMIHPRTGWVSGPTPPEHWLPAQQLVAALTVLQIYAVALNLIPLPPLDGFNAIRPLLAPKVQEQVDNPATRTGLTILLVVLVMSGAVDGPIQTVVFKALSVMGYQPVEQRSVFDAFRLALFGAR